MTFPMDRRPGPVAVEYTSRGKRVTKTFATARAAKAFYVAKARAGKCPRVVGDETPLERWLATTQGRDDGYWGGEPAPLRPEATDQTQSVDGPVHADPDLDSELVHLGGGPFNTCTVADCPCRTDPAYHYER